MQGKHLFEYAVVRVVPRVEREEFVNVGIILYCQSQRFLKVLFHLNESKINVICPDTDIAELELYLKALENICTGSKEGGAIGVLPLASRFRWLTATRSSVIQSSKVHPGFCIDPEQTLLTLFEQMVL